MKRGLGRDVSFEGGGAVRKEEGPPWRLHYCVVTTDREERVALREALNHGSEFTEEGVYGSVGEARSGLAGSRARVALVSDRLGRQAVSECVRGLKGQRPWLMVVVMGETDEAGWLDNLGAVGCDGLLTRPVNPLQCRATLRLLVSRRRWWQVGGREGEPPVRTVTRRPRLTEREREALGLKQEGVMHKEAAVMMGVPRTTFDKVVRELYRKLGVHTLAQAMKAYERWEEEDSAEPRVVRGDRSGGGQEATGIVVLEEARAEVNRGGCDDVVGL